MKKILYLLTALACFLMTNIPTLHAQEEEESFRLMVFGDSLSAGYRLQPQEAFYSRLEDALNAKGYDNVKVINASISGNTTAQGLARVDKAIEQKPHAVLLELGINDVLQGLSLQKAEENLEQIIQMSALPIMEN